MRRCKKGKPCKGVEQLHHYDDYLTGLFVVQTYTITAKNMKRAGKHIGYRIPKHQGKGRIWLNFCPWCGVDQRDCGMVDAKRKQKKPLKAERNNLTDESNRKGMYANRKED